MTPERFRRPKGRILIVARGAVDGSGLAFLETCAVGQSGTLSMNNCRDHGKFLWREPIMTHHARFFCGHFDNEFAGPNWPVGVPKLRALCWNSGEILSRMGY